MFLRLTCICFVLCVFGQVNSTPTFGTNGANSGGTSIIGDLLRRKAQFFDNMRQHFVPAGQTSGTISLTAGSGHANGNLYGSSNLYATGNPYGSSNLYGSGNPYGSSNLYGSGSPYGSSNLYGSGPIPKPTVVPTSLLELITACMHQNFLDVNVAQNLGYVSGEPEYLFQYVNELGQIIPIQREVAIMLVPNLGI